MTQQHIVVDACPRDDLLPLLRTADQLAQRLNAELAALCFAWPHFRMSDMAVQNPIAGLRAEHDMKREIEKARQVFEAVLGDRATAIDWCSGVAQPLEAVIDHLYTADLFITAETTSSLCAMIDPVDLAVRSGSSVVRLKAGSTGDEFSRVLIAWKDGPAARRAVHAARPLLALANEIFVVGVGDEVASERLEEIATFLGKGGSHCRAVHVEKSYADVGADIMRFAQDEGIRLLVSGVKAERSIRERLFGDVTGKLESYADFSWFMSA